LSNQLADMNFSQTTNTTGLGGRLQQSLRGVVGGILLLFVGVGLLWWNEGRTLKQFNALAEMEEQVVSIPNDKIEPENDGRLIHLTGSAQTDEALSDPIFAVLQDGLALKRTVEMYQWAEDTQSKSKTNIGGSETTTTQVNYEKRWSRLAIDSSEFQNSSQFSNPPMKYTSALIPAQRASLGAFAFDQDKISQLRSYQDLPLTDDQIRSFPADFGMTPNERDGFIYGKNGEAQIGDYRLKFEYIPTPLEVSMMGVQSGSSVSAYIASNGNSNFLISEGSLTPSELIKTAQTENTWTAWGYRGLGIFILIIAFKLLFAPIGILASIIPFFGRIVDSLTGSVAFLLGLILGLLVIGIAWLAVRPIIGGSLLGAAVLCFGLTFFLRKKQSHGVDTQAVVSQVSPTPTPVTTVPPAAASQVAPTQTIPAAVTPVAPVASTAAPPVTSPPPPNPFDTTHAPFGTPPSPPDGGVNPNSFTNPDAPSTMPHSPNSQSAQIPNPFA
jgi:hypothetical protein